MSVKCKIVGVRKTGIVCSNKFLGSHFLQFTEVVTIVGGLTAMVIVSDR